MRTTLLSLTLVLTFLHTHAQSTLPHPSSLSPLSPTCSNFNGGTFYINSPTLSADKAGDTTIIYRGLKYWIEANLKTHTCRISKIEWTDACNFTLKPDTVFDEDKKQFPHIPGLAGTYFYRADTIDSTGITYKVHGGISEKTHFFYVKLHPLKDTIPWQYLIYADTNLYFDTTEIKKLYGNPPKNYIYNVPYFINLQTDSAETHFVDYVISLFQNGDIKPAFDYASAKLKARSPQPVIDDYNQYVQHLFGRLKSYTVKSISDGYLLTKESHSHSYVITGEFEKIKGTADLCISTAPGSANPLLSVNIADDSINKIPFFTELTRNFWTSLKQKKFRKIYDSASLTLKSSGPYENAEKSLATLDSMAHLGSFTLYFQNFTATNDKGMIILSYKNTMPALPSDRPDKSLYINLIYTFEDGEYKLAGLNLPKK